MTLANMRENDVRAVIATCEACGHKADVNVDALPESVTVPKAAQHLLGAARYGEKRISTRPHIQPNVPACRISLSRQPTGADSLRELAISSATRSPRGRDGRQGRPRDLVTSAPCVNSGARLSHTRPATTRHN